MTTLLSNEVPLLKIRDLTVWFNTPKGMRLALDRVSFDIQGTDALGVVGESGSGKSVLSKAIVSILPKNAGFASESEVSFRHTDMLRSPQSTLRKIRGKRIAMIFQDPMTALNPVRTIGTQLIEGMRLHLNLSRASAREKAIDLLNDVGISDPKKRIDQHPHELSGGMRQRIMIAMAISCEPEMLIADEATTALDVTVQAEILELISALRQSRKMALMLITHDLGVAANYTDRIAVMYGGQLLELGATGTVFNSPVVPYTRALLDAVPRLSDVSHATLRTIPGRARPFTPSESGCHFFERCTKASQRCRDEHPPVSRSGAGQEYYCWNPSC